MITEFQRIIDHIISQTFALAKGIKIIYPAVYQHYDNISYQPPNPVHDSVDVFSTDGVVTTGVVVGSILLAGNQLLGMEELAVRSGTDLI